GVLLLDSQLRIVYVNPAGERLMQVPRDRVIGQPARTVFPGVLDPDAERHYERVISERTAAHFTQQYHNGEREFFAEIDAYPTEDRGIAIFWRDVTARVQAEAAVRASEAKYRLLFDSIDEAFCVAEVILDDAGTPVDYVVLEANPEFVRQTGLENPVGRRIRQLIPAHEEHWIQTIGRVATSGEAVRFQDRVEALNRWYDVFAFRFGDPEDRTVAILFHDISAARSVEEQRELLLVAESEARSAAERARIEA